MNIKSDTMQTNIIFTLPNTVRIFHVLKRAMELEFRPFFMLSIRFRNDLFLEYVLKFRLSNRKAALGKET